MSRKILVQDVVHPHILECKPSETLRRVTERMSEHASTAVLVIENDQAIGIWTEKDVLNFDFLTSNASTTSISEVMCLPVKTISGSMTLNDVTLAFNQDETQNYLVLGHDGRRLGIINQTDIVLSHDLNHFLHMRRVDEIVQPTVSIRKDATLSEAAYRMRESETDAIIVLPDSNVFSTSIGILSQRDLIRALAGKMDHAPVGEIATPSMLTVDKDETVFSARKTMIENGFRHLGVCDRAGHLMGIINFSAVLKCMQEIYFEGLRSVLERRSEALQRSQKHLALAEKIIEFSMDGILVTNELGVIQSVNPAFTQIMGYAPKEIIGKTTAILNSGRHDQVFYAVMWRQLKSQGHWQGEIWNRDKNGTIRPQSLAISQIPDDEGDSYSYAAMYRDISKMKEDEAEAQRLAFYDPLTGLPNRRAIEGRLEKKLATASRRRKYGALLYIDLDHFKPINDSLGHAIGDLLLIKVADRLSKILREEDTAARYGGDEFLVLLPELDDEMKVAAGFAQTVAEKIEVALQFSYQVEEHRLTLGASIGIAMFPEKHLHYKEILEQADIAMYRAKSSHQKVQFYDAARQASVAVRTELERDLSEALAQGALSLDYVPQVDTSSTVIGLEVVLCWNHPEKGRITLCDDLMAVEKSQSILPLGLWTLREVCMQAHSWATEKVAFRQLSLNICTHLFMQSDFVAQVERILQETGVDPRLLIFELTEGMVFSRFEEAVQKMKALKSCGIRFAIDDFGSGRSSLSALKILPLDTIKINYKYVHDVYENPNNGVIVQTIIAIACAMDFHVVAEGIEGKAELRSLKDMGCRAFQGDFICRSLTASEVPQVILNPPPRLKNIF
ncbi:diguanylate cyclase/phosphodiesterase (GGDEF & EAL domains) with PAS/PAC sensor(s) [hydrothermal vent metagenome]|uniref:Diguanylate cyclase/phosphodiesterase (GGDEF & EAL domains) with PAS/PAC sensor(S) n=1 Tax=hydrothermal vent metagenome TaxID=652676 RepID=A0A3B1D852_9ZZZZ